MKKILPTLLMTLPLLTQAQSSIFRVAVGEGTFTARLETLQDHHDGGRQQDPVRPALDVKEESGKMINNVIANIDLRLASLRDSYQELSSEVNNNIVRLQTEDNEMLKSLAALRLGLSLVTATIEERINSHAQQLPTLPQIDLQPSGIPTSQAPANASAPTDKIAEEKRNQNKAYDDVLERFKSFTDRNLPDPVFSSQDALKDNERNSRMCVKYAGDFARDLEQIKKEFPHVGNEIVENWLRNGKTLRYEAQQYLPLSSHSFRFTVLDMERLKDHVKNAIEEMKAIETIEDFACNIYSAKVLNKVYGLSEDHFKKDGQMLSANAIALEASVRPAFRLIGTASKQENLDHASYLATIGKPVIAIWPNPNPSEHGHLAVILPGLNFDKGWGGMYVPRVTNYQRTESSECGNCFEDDKISRAFGIGKKETTILYYIEE